MVCVLDSRSSRYHCFVFLGNTLLIILTMPLSTQVLRSAHTRGLVPATSLCNKSLQQVSLCELAILLQNLVTGTNFGPCD